MSVRGQRSPSASPQTQASGTSTDMRSDAGSDADEPDLEAGVDAKAAAPVAVSFVAAPGYGSSRKERLRLLLDEPESSRPAFLLSLLIVFLIVLSTVVTILESMEDLKEFKWVFALLDFVFIAVFTAEFCVRAYAHSTTARQFRRFMRSPLTILDLLTLLPFYVALAHGVVLAVRNPEQWKLETFAAERFVLLSGLRLFRLFRLFWCYSFSSFLQMSVDAIVLALWKSKEALLAYMVFLVILLIVFSTLIYYAERGPSGNASAFSSIPRATWYVAQVLTTVGFGDMEARSVAGQALTYAIMVFSFLAIPLPSILIGRNFAESWTWLKRHRPRPRGAAYVIGPTELTPAEKEAARERSRRALLRTFRESSEALGHGQAQRPRHASLGVESPSKSGSAPAPTSVPQSPATDYGHTLSMGRRELLGHILRELQRQNAVVERLVLMEQQERAEHDAEFGGPVAEAVAARASALRHERDSEGDADRAEEESFAGVPRRDSA